VRGARGNARDKPKPRFTNLQVSRHGSSTAPPRCRPWRCLSPTPSRQRATVTSSTRDDDPLRHEGPVRASQARTTPGQWNAKATDRKSIPFPDAGVVPLLGWSTISAELRRHDSANSACCQQPKVCLAVSATKPPCEASRCGPCQQAAPGTGLIWLSPSDREVRRFSLRQSADAASVLPCGARFRIG